MMDIAAICYCNAQEQIKYDIRKLEGKLHDAAKERDAAAVEVATQFFDKGGVRPETGVAFKQRQDAWVKLQLEYAALCNRIK